MFFTGDQIEYLCNVGYILVNGVGASQIIHCQDGEWTSIPACTGMWLNVFVGFLRICRKRLVKILPVLEESD